MAQSNESLSSSDVHIQYVFDTFSLSLSPSLFFAHVWVFVRVPLCVRLLEMKGDRFVFYVCVSVCASFWFVSGCNSFVGLQQSQSLCSWNWGSLILMRNPCSIYPALLLSQNLDRVCACARVRAHACERKKRPITVFKHPSVLSLHCAALVLYCDTMDYHIKSLTFFQQ